MTPRREPGVAGLARPLRSLALVLLVVAATACATDAPPARATLDPPLARALVTVEDVQRSIDDEKVFAQSYDRLPRPGEPWFVVLDGCAEVLLTAPHATKPTRDGALRFADTGTGSLATSLHRLTGARVNSTPRWRAPPTRTTTTTTIFKAAVAAASDRPEASAGHRPAQITRDFRPYDVDFGTMGRRLASRARRICWARCQAALGGGAEQLSLWTSRGGHQPHHHAMGDRAGRAGHPARGQLHVAQPRRGSPGGAPPRPAPSRASRASSPRWVCAKGPS